MDIKRSRAAILPAAVRKLMKSSLHIGLFALTVLTLNAPAAIRILSPDLRIQDSVSVCQNADTILLENGVYDQNVIINDIGLVLASRFVLDGNPDHIGATRINGESIQGDTLSCVAVVNHHGGTTRIIGMTIENGLGTFTETINDVAGGAVFALSNISIDHCEIRESQASYGGGIFVQSESTEDNFDVLLTSSIIESCSASLYGAGGWIKNVSLFARDVTVSRNSTPGDGGALYVDRGTQDICDCSFEANVGAIAGLYISRGEGTLQQSVFIGNGGGENGLDSHLHCSGGSALKIHSCRFSESQGGNIGIFLYGRMTDSIPDFYGNVIRDNNSFDLTGTVAMITGYGRIHHNVFIGNQNVNGGALYVADGAFLRADHNVFESNVSTKPESGSVVLMNGNCNFRLDSNIISGNSGTTLTCVSTDNCQNTVHAENNWWGDVTGPYHPTLNPGGLGDTLSWDRAVFVPWLTSPPDTSLSIDADDNVLTISSTWRLMGIFPNPFNNEFRIDIAGFTDDQFDLALYDLLGREIAVIYRGRMPGGSLHVSAPPELSSGIYFVRAADRTRVDTRKVVLLK